MLRNHFAYTLVELLIATALSLILLLGAVEMFRSVAGTMNDTKATLNMSANMQQVAALLRQDLAQIPASLADKPHRITSDPAADITDTDGYLEIVEGNPAANPYKNDYATVGDVDDIIAFTTRPNTAVPYRGIIGTQPAERTQAEILWFMRGTTLYRRVRLIDDQNTTGNGIFSPSQLADRDNRYGHYGNFPQPLYSYDSSTSKTNIDKKYWLRLPTLEETLSNGWTAANNWHSSYTLPQTPVDLWTTRFPGGGLDPKSGSLSAFVSNPRNPRAGEDVVLTNVISFDIKVWSPEKNRYIDLGGEPDASPDKFSKFKFHNAGGNSALPCVFDSWKRDDGTHYFKIEDWDSASSETETGWKANPDHWIDPPPYTEKLKGIQIMIRCFDPQSKAVKQVTVIHSF